jgi:hypothetical protein
MGDYYNKTRTPICVTLRRGGSASIGPKTWCFVAPEDEGTSSLATHIRKGFLVKALVPFTNVAEPVVAAPVVVAPVVPLVVAVAVTPVPESVAPSVSAPEPVVVAPSVVEPKYSRRNNK